MKIFKVEDFVNEETPTPGQFFRRDILTGEEKANDLGGILGILPPGSQVPYHVHKNRESLIFVISGEAVEILDGEEHPIKTNDVLFIPPGEKHMVVNRSDREFRYIEFFTYPPTSADFIEVK